MELVTVKNNQIFTDSKIISYGVGIKHHSIQQLIAKYENDISEFGQLAFEMRPVKYSRGTNFEKNIFSK